MRTFIAVAACVLVSVVASADTVVLKDGGTVVGKVTVTATDVVVDIRPGMSVSFSKDKVKEILFEKTPLEEFEQGFAKLGENDAQGFYSLGLWAKEKGLKQEAEKCFRKVVGIMPDHTGARKELGHIRHKGEWLPYEEAMKANGLEEHKGRWVTPGEKEQLEKEERIKELKKEVRKLVLLMSSTDKNAAEKASETFAGICDPLAIPALEAAATHRKPFIRHLAIQVYGKFKPELVTGQLVRMAVTDDDERIRKEAAQTLRKIKSPDAYIGILKNFYFNPDGDIRLWSMEALQVLKDKSSVAPLIESVAYEVRRMATVPNSAPDTFVGTQSRKVVGYRQVRDPYGKTVDVPLIGTVTSGFGGGGEQKLINDVIFNLGARLALKEITGKDFNYDKKEWRDWWEKNKEKFDPFMEPKEKDSDK